MAKQKKKVRPLSTIWEVSDELWEIIRNILDELDPHAKGETMWQMPPCSLFCEEWVPPQRKVA